MKPAKHLHELELIHPRPNPMRDKIAWYKWEFLRRNSLYRDDHRNFERKFGSWFEKRGYWYDYRRRLSGWTKADEDYFYERIAPTILKLCQKWQIGNLFPPDWKFNRKTRVHKILGRELGLPTDVAPEMNWDLNYLREMADLGFSTFTTSATRKGHLVLAEFDLEWTMKDLVDYAKRMLAYARRNYHDEIQRRGGKVRRGRRRLEDYEAHLRVWDLRHLGKRPLEIATKLFPQDAPEQGLRKVQDHLKAAETLIAGHYKEIR